MRYFDLIDYDGFFIFVNNNTTRDVNYSHRIFDRFLSDGVCVSFFFVCLVGSGIADFEFECKHMCNVQPIDVVRVYSMA